MSKKVLFVAKVVKGHIACFHLPYLKMLQAKGYEVHVFAHNDYAGISDQALRIPHCDRFWAADFRRFPLHSGNFKAYWRLKKILRQQQYALVHCHTPIAAAITRLALRRYRKKVGCQLLYTAHGLHFFQGSSLFSWLFYYPIEKFLARYTDVLITINEEDAQRSAAWRARRHYKVPGVGLDLVKLQAGRAKPCLLRQELGLAEQDMLMCSIGELQANKNHRVGIELLARLRNPRLHYLIAGSGALAAELQALAASLQVESQLHLLGYRQDIAHILNSAQIFLFPSHREGLPLSVMEAMGAQLPVVCSAIRGNRDLIVDQKGGYLIAGDDIAAYTKAVRKLLDSPELRRKMGAYNFEQVQQYSLASIAARMEKIYSTCLAEQGC